MSVTLYHPPPSMWTPPPWTLDFSEGPITDPPTGGGWTLDFSESPTDPSGGGGWTLDFLKSPTATLPTLHQRVEHGDKKRGRGHIRQE